MAPPQKPNRSDSKSSRRKRHALKRRSECTTEMSRSSRKRRSECTTEMSSSSRKRRSECTTEMFKVPFDLECDECGSMIAKGVILNATKVEVGRYYGRQAWSFTTECSHCENKIVIEENLFDPNYKVMAGARKFEPGKGKTNIELKPWEEKGPYSKNSSFYDIFQVFPMTTEEWKKFTKDFAQQRSAIRQKLS